MDVQLDGAHAGSAEGVMVNVGRLVIWIVGDRLRIWGDSAGGEPLVKINLESLKEAYEALPDLMRLAKANGWGRQALLELTGGDSDADYARSVGSILWHSLETGDDPDWLEEMLGRPPG